MLQKATTADPVHPSYLAAVWEVSPGTAVYCHQSVLSCCYPLARWTLVMWCRARCWWCALASNPPLCMNLGELPNSLQDKKQIQLFYPESEERMCKIKEKNIALKFAFLVDSLTCSWSYSHPRPVRISEKGSCIWLHKIEKTELAKHAGVPGTRAQAKLLFSHPQAVAEENWHVFWVVCWGWGCQPPKQPSGSCPQPHWPLGQGSCGDTHSSPLLSPVVWAATTAPRLTLGTVTGSMKKTAELGICFTWTWQRQLAITTLQ